MGFLFVCKFWIFLARITKTTGLRKNGIYFIQYGIIKDRFMIKIYYHVMNLHLCTVTYRDTRDNIQFCTVTNNILQ